MPAPLHPCRCCCRVLDARDGGLLPPRPCCLAPAASPLPAPSLLMLQWKSPDILGLHPRDVYLFASDVGIGQRAMLAARGGACWRGRQGATHGSAADRGGGACERPIQPGCCCFSQRLQRHLPPAFSLALPAAGAILLRTDVCKAVVYHDKAVLFPSRWEGCVVRQCCCPADGKVIEWGKQHACKAVVRHCTAVWCSHRGENVEGWGGLRGTNPVVAS